MRQQHRSVDPAGRSGRRTVALAAAFAMVLAPLVGVAVASAPAPARAATPVEVESPDFASENYSDAWDYSNKEDQNTDFTQTRSGSIGGGKYTMSIGPGDWIDPVDTVSGSLPYGRDGAVKPVDSGRYQRLSFSMDQPNGGIGAIYWWTCREKSAACTGGLTFPLTKGQHTYDVALDGASILGAKVPWRSGQIVAFRLQPVVVPNNDPAVTVSLDWMRLHAGTSAHAALPPGDYGSYRIEALPEPVVDSPSPSDGEDLATAQRGRPWDFTSAANASGVTLSNARLAGYGSDGMTATNTGPSQNDPIVNLPVNGFDGSRYHWLSWDMTYDGGFSLAETPGGGKMARIVWWDAASPGTPQIGNDLLTHAYENAAPATVDLTASNPLDEDAVDPKLGWGGQTVQRFRFDPNEDPGAATWHLKSVHLRADPAATERTTVKFHDAAWVAGTTATIKVGTGPLGSAYTTIASNVAVNQGSNSATFALGSMPAGSYHVEVDLYHPAGGGALAFSQAPISMSHDTSRDPRGSLDSVSGTTAGVTASGWAFDPDASGGTDVAVYDQTSGATYIGQYRTSSPRPDVASAVAGAPANTGYSATFPLSAGTHTICAYGINVGTGTENPLLGCRSVTVTADRSHDPRGSLDSVTPAAGAADVHGWAFDPDATGATSVAYYDGSTYVGQYQTGVSRTDVQRAVPGAPANSGFETRIPLAAGGHTICAYAINVGPGTENPLLGCAGVTVSNGSIPQGSFDQVSGGTGSASLSGWAWDADGGSAANAVHVYDQSGNRFLTALQTGGTRSDVAQAVAGAPGNTGWSGSVSLTAGAHTLCVYAINVPGGDNPLLGCKAVTVR